MQTDRFGALTTSLARGLSRRRSLGLLAALGAAATLASDAEAGKHKKKHKKKPKKPCGGACGDCQACFNGACAQVADGAACSSGQCFDGTCLTCPGGKVPAEGLCATPCTSQGDCATGACLKMANDSDGTVADTRKFCVKVDGQSGNTMPHCDNGRSSDCRSGMLCVDYATAIRCAVPA